MKNMSQVRFLGPGSHILVSSLVFEDSHSITGELDGNWKFYLQGSLEIFLNMYINVSGAKFPFVMKLCFSSSRQIGQGKGQNPNKSQNQNQDQNNQRQGQNNGLAEHEY